MILSSCVIFTSRRPTFSSVVMSSLADHLRGGLVVAQTEEAGVAQATVASPLGEPDLGHELRLDPGHVPLFDRRWFGERRVGAPERPELGAEVVQRLGVEPGPDLARVLELFVPVVAEQERAELDARAPRLGEAADDELLPVLALELQPVARASRDVRAVRALGDEALPAFAARLLEVLRPVAVPVGGPADVPVEAEGLLEQPF